MAVKFINNKIVIQKGTLIMDSNDGGFVELECEIVIDGCTIEEVEGMPFANLTFKTNGFVDNLFNKPTSRALMPLNLNGANYLIVSRSSDGVDLVICGAFPEMGITDDLLESMSTASGILVSSDGNISLDADKTNIIIEDLVDEVELPDNSILKVKDADIDYIINLLTNNTQARIVYFYAHSNKVKRMIIELSGRYFGIECDSAGGKTYHTYFAYSNLVFGLTYPIGGSNNSSSVTGQNAFSWSVLGSYIKGERNDGGMCDIILIGEMEESEVKRVAER